MKCLSMMYTIGKMRVNTLKRQNWVKLLLYLKRITKKDLHRTLLDDMWEPG